LLPEVQLPYTYFRKLGENFMRIQTLALLTLISTSAFAQCHVQDLTCDELQAANEKVNEVLSLIDGIHQQKNTIYKGMYKNHTDLREKILWATLEHDSIVHKVMECNLHSDLSTYFSGDLYTGFLSKIKGNEELIYNMQRELEWKSVALQQMIVLTGIERKCIKKIDEIKDTY